jgi:hypothetical protein
MHMTTIALMGSLASRLLALRTSFSRLKEEFPKAMSQAHSDGTLSMTSSSGLSHFNALPSKIPPLKQLHTPMTSSHSAVICPAFNNRQT